jgi:hypothetical protein
MNPLQSLRISVTTTALLPIFRKANRLLLQPQTLLLCCCRFPYSLLGNTTVSSSSVGVAAGGSSTDAVATASLAAVGATLQTNFSGGGLQGFVLDIPADVDEADVVSKLSAHHDVMRVVPDTWVGIAVATGEQP